MSVQVDAEGDFLPCPFCGNMYILEHRFDYDEPSNWLTCGYCFTDGPHADSRWVENGKTALEKWNTRWKPVEGK